VRAAQPLSAHRTANRAIEMSLLFCLPAAAGQALLAVPLIEVLFQRGAFGPAEAAATAGALAAYALGLPAYVLVKVLVPGFFARGDTATPVKIGFAAVGLNLALNLALIGPLAHIGVALSTALAAWFNAGALGVLLWRRGHLLPDRRLRRRLPKLLGATALMAAVLWALAPLLFPAAGLWRYGALALLVGAGLVSYFGTAAALGALSLGELRQTLRRRRPAKA
jgi:putative peptidoglycan lipid II flippase